METQSNNIVTFPRENTNRFSLEQLEELKLESLNNKKEFAEFLTEDILDELFFKLNLSGFSFNEEHFSKDCVLVEEAFRSLILKYIGVEHPMQGIAEKVIDFKTD